MTTVGQRSPLRPASTAAPNDRPMAEMHAVERPDRDRARTEDELRCGRSDVHAAAPSCGPSRASTPARTASGTRSSAPAGSRASASADRQELRLLDRARLFDVERADGGAAQRRAVAVERLGDRPDVGAGADVEREAHRLPGIRDHLERVHERTPHRHLDDDAPPRELVRPLAADLDRRRGRDRQLDLAAEALERLLERRLRRCRMLLELLAFRIAGRRRRGQIDIGDVALVQADEAGSESGCGSGQQHQQAGCERVERSRVTGPRTRPPPQRRDDRKRRRPRRLVDQRDPDRSKRSGRHRRPGSPARTRGG